MSAKYFDQRMQELNAAGKTLSLSVEDPALAYINGNPTRNGKRLTRAKRHAASRFGNFLTDLPAPALHSQALVLALLQKMGHARISNMVMLANMATLRPRF